MPKHRILIVDDQRDARRVLRAGLETLGADMRVVDVPSGEEAMLLLTAQSFDLLIADVRLPGISGLELMARLAPGNPDLKWFLITGVSDPRVKEQVAEAGAYAYFLKPVEMADFLDAVERCLGLVDTLLPPALVNDQPGEQSPTWTFSDRLSSLRRGLNARAVVLLDEQGQALARAGELPDQDMEASLIPALLSAAYSACRVSTYLGSAVPEDLLCFFSDAQDLFLAPVGASLALLLALPGRVMRQKTGDIWAAVQPATRDLLEILERMGVPGATLKTSPLPENQPEAQAEPEELEEENLPALDEIFNQATQASPKVDDLDAFWDSLAEQGEMDGVINADVISYDQARRLGLAPGEEDENPSKG